MLTNRVSRTANLHSLTALLAGTALIALVAFEADAVESQAEVQINLCSDSTQLVRALHLAEQGKPTTVWLFDTPGLELNRNGLRLRVRERGELADLTLKAAGQDCSKVNASLLGGQGKCEADLHGDSFEDVVSLERTLDRRSLKALLAPEAGSGAPLANTLSKLLTTNQRKLIGAKRGVAASAPLPPDIKRLGPSIVQAYRASRSAVWRRGLGAAGRRAVRRTIAESPTRDSTCATHRAGSKDQRRRRVDLRRSVVAGEEQADDPRTLILVRILDSRWPRHRRRPVSVRTESLSAGRQCGSGQPRNTAQGRLSGVETEAKVLVRIRRVKVGRLVVVRIPSSPDVHATFVLTQAD